MRISPELAAAGVGDVNALRTLAEALTRVANAWQEAMRENSRGFPEREHRAASIERLVEAQEAIGRQWPAILTLCQSLRVMLPEARFRGGRLVCDGCGGETGRVALIPTTILREHGYTVEHVLREADDGAAEVWATPWVAGNFERMSLDGTHFSVKCPHCQTEYSVHVGRVVWIDRDKEVKS